MSYSEIEKIVPNARVWYKARYLKNGSSNFNETVQLYQSKSKKPNTVEKWGGGRSVYAITFKL